MSEELPAEVVNRTAVARSLKALRAFTGLTAKSLSLRSGVPLGTLQTIEAEKRPINSLQIALIASATGAAPRALARGELLEWNGSRSYNPGSFGRWLEEGQFRSVTELRKDLENIQKKQLGECENFSPELMRLYVAYSSTVFELNMTRSAFLEVAEGIPSLWTVVDSVDRQNLRKRGAR